MVEIKVKEKPILFSTPMVKAILECRKTQTRRVLKLKKGDTIGRIYDEKETEYIICGPDGDEVFMEFVSPYGVWGDRLWVREGFATEKKFDDKPMSFFDNASDVPIWYRADDIDYKNDYVPRGKWRPSIFIPRWASRITLEITNISIQKLQDISHQDITAEGLGDGYTEIGWNYAYGQLWNKLNEKRGYGWSTNPWVWAISFKRV